MADNESSKVDKDENVDIYLIAAFGSIVFFFVFVAPICICINAHRRKQREANGVKCYLCFELVGHREWADGSHRDQCAQHHSRFLNLLPTHKSIKCGKCEGPLILWPANLNASFKCNLCDNFYDEKLQFYSINESNFGRYNCMKCDFNICTLCTRNKAWID